MSGRVVGLDVGGSKTHAVLADGTGVLAETVVGSANVASVGAREAARQLSDRAGPARRDRRRRGLRRRGRRRLRRSSATSSLRCSPGLLPTARVEVVHDAQLLLAAAGLDTGIALISGTGSVAWGLTPDGRSARAGGWGYLLGDEGSGYGVARAAVRHALRRLDRAAAPDRLTAALVDGLRPDRPGAPAGTLLRQPGAALLGPPGRRGVRLAAAGDPAARAIVDEAAAALAGLVRTVAGRARQPRPAGLRRRADHPPTRPAGPAAHRAGRGRRDRCAPAGP